MIQESLFDYVPPTQVFGTEPRKLVRRDAPDTSVQAACSVDTSLLESLVYNVIRRYPDGVISDRIRDSFPEYPYSSVTARYKALIDKGLIEDTGRREKGDSGRSQRVLRAL